MDPSHPALVVCLHDVSPASADEVRAALDALAPLVDVVTCGVIPRPRGARWCRRDGGGLAEEVTERTGERLLHGLTHRRAISLDPLSWLSGRSDELAGLDASAASARLTEGRAIAAELFGAPPQGLLPPAWRRGALRGGLPSQLGFEYLVGLWRLLPSVGASVEVATWSWDWGALAIARRGAGLPAALSQLRARLDQRPPPCPVVAIHPTDVDRGELWKATAVIRRLLDEGYRPRTFSDLLAERR